MLDKKTIYVEKQAFNYANTKSIISNIAPSNIIEIDNYKDIFCRAKQNPILQHNNQKIILAVNSNNFLYKGAPVCQDFGNANFYYSSCVKNCICDCKYCYLKGMYPSANLVIFVNLDDYFKHIENTNSYICVSYDTDLFPLESYTHYIEKWLHFANSNKNVTIEIRTKNKNLNIWKYQPADNVIFAFSFSPKTVIEKFEHKTSNFDARLLNIITAQKKGFKTRLCFDPIILCKNWKWEYSNMIEKIFMSIDMNKLHDVSVGSFRISQSYLKNMRKHDNTSQIVNFPFDNISGYYQYPKDIQISMENYVVNCINKYFCKDRIFLWK